MSKATLVFYKAKGSILDKVIRFWTKSKYSHVELVVDGDAYSSFTRNSSGATCRKDVVLKVAKWDSIAVELDYDLALRYFKRHEGKGYDYLGILCTQFFPLSTDDPVRVFCSELCAGMLGLDEPAQYSPEDLYRYYKDKE